MTDWDRLLACDVCPALQGQACYIRSSGGPEALPEIRSEVPHSGRKLSARLSPKPATVLRSPQTARTANPVRRRAARSATTAANWQALADKQRRRSG
jgi:hypothetical protein